MPFWSVYKISLHVENGKFRSDEKQLVYIEVFKYVSSILSNIIIKFALKKK